MRRTSRFFLALLLAVGLAHVGGAQPAPDYFAPVPEAFYDDLAFDMPRVPVPTIPDYEVSITDFGAIGDGETLNTDAFATAIAHISERGGGRVVVPAGIWRTGPIQLASNLDLRVERGALVLFDPDTDLYPLIETSFEGLDTYRMMSPIYGIGLENIAITGEGIFDGSGDAWRGVHRDQLTEDQWEDRVASGGVLSDDGRTWYPNEVFKNARGDNAFNVPLDLTTRAEFEAIKEYLRPVLVSIRESRNVLLDGPTFQNSPAWAIHPLMSENVIVRNLTVRNPTYSWNGDGLDLESVKNAVVYYNSFDVGDDAICLKSGKNEDGRRRGMPTENVLVRENTVYHAHGGFVVGSEMSGGVRNIDVRKHTFIGTDVGLRFKSTRGRGGTVENIWISDIEMVDIVTEPLRFNLYYGGDAPDPDAAAETADRAALRAEIPPVTEETPQFRDIHIRDVRCRGAGRALWVQGLPEQSVENVTVERMDVTARRGALVTEVNGFTFDDVTLTVDEGPVLFLHNGHDVALDGVRLATTDDGGIGLMIRGPFTENVRLTDVEGQDLEQTISVGADVDDGAVHGTK